MTTKEKKTEDSNYIIDSRELITKIVTIAVVSITLFIAIVLIVYPLWKGTELKLDFIGQSLLPLWGTWIGTVLAFYFGKANFEAASKSYQDVIKTLTPEDKIAKILAQEVMLPYDKIEKLEYERDKDKKIGDILGMPNFKNFSRYAIFDQKKIFKFIIHKSTIYQFIAQKVEESKNSGEIKTLTLQNLIDDSNNEIKSMLLKGYNFVPVTASLLDAKKAMDAIQECQDVFITETGKVSEPVLGLITNNMILEKSKV